MSKIDDARDKMAESLINLCDFKVTLPLSDKTRNIHTNTWIYFEPLPFMDEMDKIYESMGASKSTRYCFYRKGYWYVKATKITYSNTDGKIELTLSPFPPVFNTEKITNTTNTTSSNTNNKVSDGIKAPSWLNSTDKLWAEQTVRRAIGTNKTKLLKAKAVYNYFKNHYGYQGYSNLKYTTPKGNRKSAFLRGKGNCADGANILETLMLTAGINARIKHAPNHYIVKLVIDGRTYWVDNHGTKSWNRVWRGKVSENEGDITKGVYING